MNSMDQESADEHEIRLSSEAFRQASRCSKASIWFCTFSSILLPPQTRAGPGENLAQVFTGSRQVIEKMTAGPVSRILSAGLHRQDDHSSRRLVAEPLLWRPTRNFHPVAGGPKVHAPSQHVPALLPYSFPIWSCSVWGLPCPVHCWAGGALLPHLFTLTALARRRYVFCGTGRPPA